MDGPGSFGQLLRGYRLAKALDLDQAQRALLFSTAHASAIQHAPKSVPHHPGRTPFGQVLNCPT
jgi:hypothetical protein